MTDYALRSLEEDLMKYIRMSLPHDRQEEWHPNMKQLYGRARERYLCHIAEEDPLTAHNTFKATCVRYCKAEYYVLFTGLGIPITTCAHVLFYNHKLDDPSILPKTAHVIMSKISSCDSWSSYRRDIFEHFFGSQILLGQRLRRLKLERALRILNEFLYRPGNIGYIAARRRFNTMT